MKHVFIINPVSGSRKAKAYIPEIEKYFTDKPEQYDIIYTKYPLHTKEICKEYSKIDDVRIYIAGGDGSFNEAVNGVAGTNTPVGILPAGSGNDFIKVLTDYKNRTDIVKRTIEGDVIKVDALKLYDDPDFDYCINILSMGMDAETAYNSTIYTRKFGLTGMPAYLLGILRAMRQKRIKFDVKVTVDSVVVYDDFLILAACTNGKYYGGGFIPVPYTKFDDGIIDLCVVEARSIGYMFRVLPKFMKGKHEGIEGMHFFKGTNVELQSKEPLRLNIEGEIVERSYAKMEMVPKFINVIKPKG